MAWGERAPRKLGLEVGSSGWGQGSGRGCAWVVVCSPPWPSGSAFSWPALPSFLAPADASDAKARERRRGGPLPTSSKEASEAKDPR